MSAPISDDDKQARKLRELFRGRFDQETAKKLINELGGLYEAVDFVMTEDETQVSAFLKRSPDYLQGLRTDSAKVATILDNKIQDSVRQFVCGDCSRSWWKRVPLRKEVSKCRRCHFKYDPIPRKHESGVGKFQCPCGNDFTGFACMGETISECYKCGTKVPVDHMIPPRKNRDRKTTTSHSCNGVNCYNGDQNRDQTNMYMPNKPFETHDTWIPVLNKPRRQAEPPACAHPKSQRRALRHVSKKHVSTGSTVSTFLSQNSLETDSVSVVFSLFSIDEEYTSDTQ